MIPNILQHSLTRLFSKQREYCSDWNIHGVYYIERKRMRL